MSREIAGLPDGVVAYRSSAIFRESTIPQGLLHAHRTAPWVWGLIEVLEGRLLFGVAEAGVERMLAAGCAPAVTEPGIPHLVARQGPVRLQIKFYRRPDPAVEEAGVAKA